MLIRLILDACRQFVFLHVPVRTHLALWLGAALLGMTTLSHAQTPGLRPIVVVATPNPNVFPLLLALERQPQLPVTLLAVADGAGFDKAFVEQGADAMLAMTATIAAKVAGGAVPPLRLTDIALWRGFTAMVMADVPARTLANLKGKGFILSGPTTGGRDGGPDLLFQAALARSGLKPDDLKLCHLPVKVGVEWLMEHKPLGDHANCEPDKDIPAVGMLLVEPAVSGLALMSRMPFKPKVDARIDIEPIFSGFKAWPADQLPHGGMAVRDSTLADPSRQEALRLLRAAYAAAIDEINAARDQPIARLRLARTISSSFDRRFGGMGLELPSFALASALGDQRLMFRRDLSVNGVGEDLARFLEEVVKRKLPSSLYR